MSGIGFGFIENYLFIYIEELGGGKTIQGVARFVMCAAEVHRFVSCDLLGSYRFPCFFMQIDCSRRSARLAVYPSRLSGSSLDFYSMRAL